MSRPDELLREAGRKLRALAKLSVRSDRFAGHNPSCLVCLRAGLNGNAIAHAETCAVGAAFAFSEEIDRALVEVPIFSETEILALETLRAAESVFLEGDRPADPPCPVGILNAWPPSRVLRTSTERNFITGNASRFIEYEDGRDEAARIALHEEVAGR